MRFLRLIGVAVIAAIPALLSAAEQTSPQQTRTTRTIPVAIVETRCPTVVVYERGIADAFQSPADPAFPSLALDAFLHGTPVRPIVAYDEGYCDHYFGDTFKLDECVVCCGICSATLEITMHGCGSGLDCNDTLIVGEAPFGRGGVGYIIWSGYIDPTPCPTGGGTGPDDIPDAATDRARPNTDSRAQPSSVPPTVVKTFALDPRKIAELICKRKVTSLDVFVQDDQIIDSMRLIITKP